MIENVIINNFKSIKRLELKDLGKLSIFIGPNNSGKSSILQSIAFLAQSLHTRTRQIRYKDRFIDIGSFNEVIFKGRTKNKIRIELWFNLAEELGELSWGGKSGIFPLSAAFIVEIGPNGIERQTLKSLTNEILCDFHREDVNGTRTILKFNKEEVDRDGSDLSTLLGWSVKRASKRKIGSYPLTNNDVSFINGLLNNITSRLLNVYYFSTTRAVKEWTQTLGEFDFFGTTAEYAISMLHHVYSNERSVFEKIEKWIRKLGVGRLISGTKGAQASIVLEDPILEKKVNIVNFGFGVNQLLPIIGQCFASTSKSTIMVEEPEIHLHTGAIGTLVDMFLETISEDKQIIITTHSDRLVFELWARLKLGLVKNRDIRLYLVDKDSSGTFVKPIKLQKRISEVRKELKILLEPKSPLEDLLKVSGKSGDKRLSEKDLSQI